MHYVEEYNKISEYLPYKLKKRINKTAEGRSGLEIYKKRNRRDYRVIVQYKTFKSNPITFFDNYKEGYVVLISPQEFFGNNYPNASDELYEKFKLGENGFIYYGSIDEYNTYKPLESWLEVLELSTVGDSENKTWIGDYVLNIKNTNPKKISEICTSPSTKKAKKEKAAKWKGKIRQYNKRNLDRKVRIPKDVSQCGLGNYDFDYADSEMIFKVKLQMLMLVFLCKSKGGESFPEYVINNFDKIKNNKEETRTLLNKIRKPNQYIEDFTAAITELKDKCEESGLLQYDKLTESGCWGSKPICPLCCKEIYIDDFFSEIKQMEGREVFDNTQREIVLMHINPLKPGEFNHRIYNLGWGHNFCNLIQGDNTIDNTIRQLEDIVNRHREHYSI